MRFVIRLWFMGLAACGGGSGGAAVMAERDAETGSPDAGVGDADLGCAPGSTLSCACSVGGTGERACTGASYGACEGCRTGDTTSTGIKCVAGLYTGRLNGTYRSEPGGICGIVAGDPEPSLGDWSFSLVDDGNGEFYSVNAGCVHYSESRVELQDGGTNYAHRAELSGSVNCSTGELSAELRGTYVSVGKCDLGTLWTRYFYKGTMRGRFDPETHAFVDTYYEMHERMPLLGPATGGDGTWTGVLDPDAGAPADDAVDCLGDVQFPDDLAPQIILDGGV